MQREDKIELTRRLIAHVDNNTTDYADEILRVPFSVFNDPELADLEREAVRRFPHIVAHVDEVKNAGDFITTELIGTPLLVVRQPDGSVKAFSNVCRHRGAKVEFEESGCKRIFSCPYHNWAYGRDGALRGMPHADGFDGLDRSQYGLVEFPCEVRHGLVWVVPTVGAELDIAGTLGEKHDAEVTDTGMGTSHQVRKETWKLDMNWKIAVDGVQDSYHLCQLHTKTVCNFDATESIGLQAIPFVVGPRLIGSMLVVLPGYLMALVVAFVTGGIVVKTFHDQPSGTYDHYFAQFLNLPDLAASVAKALIFCAVVTMIHCYYGYFASGGPAGVGSASGRAIRASLVAIVVLNFVMTVIIWGLSPELVFKG